MKETSETIAMDSLFQQLKISDSFGKSYISDKNANVIHHCINRKYSDILRWDHRNAIPLHHNPFDKDPEHNSKNAECKTEFDWNLNPERVDYINKYKNMTLKDYLIEMNLSKKEFIEIKRKELKTIIDNY